MNSTVPDTDADAANAGATLSPVACDGVLLVRGTDAASYLDSQLSSSVQSLPADGCRLTSYSDPRGRVLATPLLLARGDEGFALVMDRGVIDSVTAQLRKYALRARVEFHDASAEWRLVGVAGASAGRELDRRLDAAAPAEPDRQCLTAAGVSVCRLPDRAPRWLLCGPAAAVDALTAGLDPTPGTDDTAWRRLDIAAGIPRVRAANQGEFVAQMINLDLLGAVDFRKGCFPGQEVIARTRYLGRIKRRMVVLSAGEGAVPAAGDPVHADGAEAAVGRIVDAVAGANGGTLALAVVRLASIAATLRLGDPGGPVAVAAEPPYGLADPEA